MMKFPVVQRTAIVVLLMILTACTTAPRRTEPVPLPPDNVDVSAIPDAVPRIEALSKTGNPESYTEFGKRYWVMPNAKGFREQGKASWYGPKFHGKRTSSGDPYDMYQMTAAHKTLPLPSYVRVTNRLNGRSVVLRVNDRGPFVGDRILDVSYVAAKKLGMAESGLADIDLQVVEPGAAINPAAEVKTVALGTVGGALPIESYEAPVVITAAPSVGVEAVGEIQHPAPPVAGTESLETVATAAPVQTGMKVPAISNEVEPATPLQSEGTIFLQVGAFSSLKNAEQVLAELASIQPYPVRLDPLKTPEGMLHRVQIGPFATDDAALAVVPSLQEKGFRQYRFIRK